MDDINKLLQFLEQRAANNILPLADQQQAAQQFHCSLRDIEERSLTHSILPGRYRRNGLDCKEQLKLLQARVSIVGCGGLGGRVAELLARLGIGSLVLTDPDIFDESNLNRQQFCTTDTLGDHKVEVIACELKKINPILETRKEKTRFSESSILAADVVVDGLDSAIDRHSLSRLCLKHSRPLIHAAVNKWYGQIGVQQPGSGLIAQLYPQQMQQSTTSQVLSPTVALLAAMQAAETCKLILGQQSPLTASWLHCDLLNCEYHILET